MMPRQENHRPKNPGCIVRFFSISWTGVQRAQLPIPSRKRSLKGKARNEAEIDHMNRVLDMLRFTCRYYDQAMQDDGEDRVKSMIPGHLPEEIRQA